MTKEQTNGWEEQFDYYLTQFVRQLQWINEAKIQEAERIAGPSEKTYAVGGFWSGFTLKDTFANRPDTAQMHIQRQQKLEMHYNDLKQFISKTISQEKEKWVENKPEEIISYLEDVFQSNYLQITSTGGEERREYVRKVLVNLLQK